MLAVSRIGTAEQQETLGSRASPTRHGQGAASGAKKTLRVLMAAGGTGGHIFPLLAVAERLRATGVVDVQFIGTNRPLESRLIPAAGFPLRSVRAAGLKGLRGWKKLQNLMVLPLGALDTAKVLADFKPAVVAGIGGYLAGPALLEAALAGIATILIEPNAVPGFTNRVLAPVVRLAAVGFERAAGFYGSKARVTGHAVRREFFDVPAAPPPPPLTLLIAGGSLGAKAVNRYVVANLGRIRERAGDWRIIHQTGEADYNAVEAAYREQGVAGEIYAFIDNMPAAFAAAHLVVSRAGASAVAELAAAGRPSLLIPFPAATDQHQLENAREFERMGAGRVLEEKDITPDRFFQEVWDLMNDAPRLCEMGRRARSLARPNAVDEISRLIMEMESE
jgi:UDP-N-acetylglucosamine--N-acetylmuramyl-(pentapeptide) pyrophosphoryl-undecaprenol N-acetylglucosamine transferase